MAYRDGGHLVIEFQFVYVRLNTLPHGRRVTIVRLIRGTFFLEWAAVCLSEMESNWEPM